MWEDRLLTSAAYALHINGMRQESVPVHTPGSIEQEHIKQALEASQTAIDAIGTVLSVSTWALGIIGIAVALIAVWGWSTLKEGAREKAKQIANERLDSYMASENFTKLMRARIDVAIKTEWQESLLKRVEEAVKPADDEAAFPTKED